VVPPSIRIGAMATIEIHSQDGAREFKTRVEDIENGFLVVATPTERGELVILPVGQVVTLAVQTASGSNLFVEGEVMGRRNAPFPVVVVRPVSIESNQQRNFHRVQVRIDPLGVWHWIGQGEPPPGARPSASDANWQLIACTIVDLSGGGVGLISETELPRDGHMYLRFPLPVFGDVLDARGRVTICRPRPIQDKVQFQVGVRFDGVSKVDQERIVKANTQFQLEQRRKARGL
jgi:c-di-GMP-binding flagellar brake protein YcgR